MGSQGNQNQVKGSVHSSTTSNDWLGEILDEVGLSQFHTKLTNDLQLTRLSHFDFVGEDDLINIGMSRPAAKRLLASIRKKKSLVTAIKNKIVNKLLPITNSSRKNSSSTLNGNNLSTSSSSRSTSPSSSSFSNISAYLTNNSRSKQAGLTCLINNLDVEIKEEIGHGVHGVVRKGLWTVSHYKKIEVALKILKNDLISSASKHHHASFDEFVKEINIMHKLNHPNLIKLYGVVLSSPMMMVTELAPYGNLRDKLRKENGRTSISLLINYADQIAYGMGYLESKRLVHRDLAARNIFISYNERIKIGDFGLMRAIPQHMEHYIMNETTRIPFPWCAPESLKLKLFSSASDTYMYAVTIWEMLSFGKEPWATLSGSEILVRLDRGERLVQPPACSTSIYQTLLQCWDPEPSNRPTFSALSNYMSTSYPLEVKATKVLSEETSNQYYPPLNPNKQADNLVCVSNKKAGEDKREILQCEVQDRIQVIDGQPENYWWKGQNQRTFNVGWFPLNITQWLGPKKQNYISKPIKNSFIHTGHIGRDGHWGSPHTIDPMYLKNPLAPIHNISQNSDQLSGVKLKTRSKLSRLFGINEPSIPNNSNQHLSDNQKSYHKLLDDGSGRLSTKKKLSTNMQRSQSQDIPTRDKGNTTYLHSHRAKEEPSLIDFSDEIQFNTTNDSNNIQDTPQTTTNGLSSKVHESLYRPLSDTNLQVFGDRYHDISQAGSWNTGTFDDAGSSSNNNNYSRYYCPQDAVVNNYDPEAYHYYSAVPYSAGGTNNEKDDNSTSKLDIFPNNSVQLSQVPNVAETNGTITATLAGIACEPNSIDNQDNKASQQSSSNIDLPQHSFPVTFDDISSSSLKPTDIIDSDKSSNKPNEIKPNQADPTDNNNIFQSKQHQKLTSDSSVAISGQQQAHLNSTTDGCSTNAHITNSLEASTNSNCSSLPSSKQINIPENTLENPGDHSPIKLSKEFIKTLESELGISPGVRHLSSSGSQLENQMYACKKDLYLQNRPASNSTPLPLPIPPPPAPSNSSFYARQSIKTSAQVAIVAPSMLTNRKFSQDGSKSFVINGVPSSREQRLINQIQKRCSGEIDTINCLQVLRRNNLDYDMAIREIQVDRLMSLQITKDKNRCERALIAANWKLENAASRLLDETL